jgi:putative oxidoreductase
LSNCEKKFSTILSEDFGKLILRLTLASLMLFHGFHKIFSGIDGIKFLVTKAGLPEALAYGVYVGEVIIPLLLILGFYTRIASLIFAINMGFAIFLAFSDKLFVLTKTGGPLIELPIFYLFVSVAILFLGAGRYSFDARCK